MTRAADDFAAIRARLEELRRDRAQASVEDDTAVPETVLRPGVTFRAVPRQTAWLSSTMQRLLIR